jgi:hypothetical protein
MAAGALAWMVWVITQGFLISIATPLDDIALLLLAALALWLGTGRTDILAKIPRRKTSNIWGVQSGDVEAVRQHSITSLNDKLTQDLIAQRQVEWEQRQAEELADDERRKAATARYEESLSNAANNQ